MRASFSPFPALAGMPSFHSYLLMYALPLGVSRIELALATHSFRLGVCRHETR